MRETALRPRSTQPNLSISVSSDRHSIESGTNAATEDFNMKYLLWTIQGLLAILFLFAGGVKLVLPLDQMQGPVSLPLWFLRFIGACEILGGLGLILPGIFRVRLGLTPLAATGLVIIMIGATSISFWGGMPLQALISIVVGLLAGFVVYGRRTSDQAHRA
jgi:hypothetical protein